MLATVFMFLFLLRSREALRNGDVPDERQCVRMLNVGFYLKRRRGDGRYYPDGGRSRALMLGASKTDPNGQGSLASHYDAPRERLCILALLKAQRMRPELVARADNYLFTKRDGRVLHRGVAAKHLSAAAVALGAPPGAAVLSLRSGGASAIWDTGMSAEEIKFRGRWASDGFKIYIWPGHDRSRNVAAKMLCSRTSRSWRRWQRTATTGSKREWELRLGPHGTVWPR